jgi:hypothetical protein
MASYVFLGHGGFNPENASYPAEILIPPGTTLRFFSDAGQALVLPATDGNTDYLKVVKVWEHFHEEDSPIPARWVTYNFRLKPDDTDEERQVAMSLDWGADVVTLPAGSAPLYLCQGTEDTCPTPALNVQQAKYDDSGDGDPVPDGRWAHGCDGILGQYAGHDLIWVACTSFTFRTPELSPLLTTDYSGPGASDVSDWVPDDAAWDEINRLNQRNVKATDDGGNVAIAAGGYLVLIGEGHSRRAGDYVARQGDVEEGMLTVEKGGAFSRGEIEVSGISRKQEEVRTTIAQFSEKKVTFV